MPHCSQVYSSTTDGSTAMLRRALCRSRAPQSGTIALLGRSGLWTQWRRWARGPRIRLSLSERVRVMTSIFGDTPIEDRPTYTYEVRTPDGMQTIQAKSMSAVSGCLGFAADRTGWIRLFAPGAWVSVVRRENNSGESSEPSTILIGLNLPGMPGTEGGA